LLVSAFFALVAGLVAGLELVGRDAAASGLLEAWTPFAGFVSFAGLPLGWAFAVAGFASFASFAGLSFFVDFSTVCSFSRFSVEGFSAGVFFVTVLSVLDLLAGFSSAVGFFVAGLSDFAVAGLDADLVVSFEVFGVCGTLGG